MLQQLILRLQQQACQRLGTGGSCTVSTHSLIPTLAAAACGNSSSCCSSIWTASTCQQQQQQHDAQPQQPHLQQLLPGQRQQPQTSSAGARLFSSSAAAADAALLSVKLPPPLPCVLNTSKPSKQRLGSANTIKYPYPLPPTYSDRAWQLRDLDGMPVGAVTLPGDVFNVPVRVDVMHQVVRWQRAKARQGTHKTKDRSEVSGGGKKPWQQKGSGRARQGSIRAPQWRGGGIVHGPVPRSYAFDLPRKVRRLGLKSALSAKANEGRLILVDSLVPTPAVSRFVKTKLMAGKLQTLVDLQTAAAEAVASKGFVGGPAGQEQGLSSLVLKQALLQLEQEQKQEKRAGGKKEQQQQKQSVLPPGSSSSSSGQAALSAVIIDSSTNGDDGGDVMRRSVRNLPGVEVVPAIGANVLSLLRRDYVILTKPGLDALIERLQRPINRLGAAGLAFRKRMQEKRAAAARQKWVQQRLAGGGAGGSGGGGSGGSSAAAVAAVVAAAAAE